ncbi:MAG TPA: META domain-containing protein [Acidimicrobiia bacterium]|jgi:heat shock protein HslJ
MRRTFLIVVAAGLLLAAAPATASASASARPPLRGTNWVLTDRVSLGTPLDGVVVNAVFAAKHVSGTSGCNGYTSSYTTNGSRMTVTNDGVSTLIACEGAAGKVEPKYLAALARVGRWRITRTTLTLSTRTGRRLLVYGASIGAQALRGSWDVTSLYTGDAISSPVEGSALTLTFDAATVSGNAGCNLFSGPYEVSGTDRITLGPFGGTLRECDSNTQEQQYLAALGLAKTYQVTGNQLTLFRDGGTIAVTAQRAS